MTTQFDRSLYPGKMFALVDEHFGTIEKCIDSAANFRTRGKYYMVREVVQASGETSQDDLAREVDEKWIAEIENKMWFFFDTTVYKLQQIIDGLVLSHNQRNLIGYSLFGRSILEHVAVFAHFDERITHLLAEDVHVEGRLRASSLATIESELARYSGGRGFDWAALENRELDDLNKRKIHPKDATRKSVHVMDAIQGLERQYSELYVPYAWLTYNLLCDCVHPNFGSHSLHMGRMRHLDESGDWVELSRASPMDRISYIVRFTIPTISSTIGLAFALLRSTQRVFAGWRKFCFGPRTDKLTDDFSISQML